MPFFKVTLLVSADGRILAAGSSGCPCYTQCQLLTCPVRKHTRGIDTGCFAVCWALDRQPPRMS